MTIPEHIRRIREVCTRGTDLANLNRMLVEVQDLYPCFQTYCEIGQVFLELGDHTSAAQAFDRAAHLGVGGDLDVDFWEKMFVVLHRVHNLADAVEVGDRLCRLGSTRFPHVREIMAGLLHMQGRYAEAWRLFWEGRASRVYETSPIAWYAHRRYDRWRGEPHHTVLVCSEMGLGDEFMFLRYLIPLAKRCEKILFVPNEQSACLALRGVYRLPQNVEIVDAGRILAGDARVHSWAPLCHLPGDLGILVPLMPNPYIAPSGASGDRGIGVVWRGNPAHPGDNLRSTTPDFYAPFEEIPRPFYSLQHPRRPDEHVPGFIKTLRIETLLDTVRYISALDLVITVDTSVAHLAGAMGKPVWLALSWDAEWRWGWTGTSTPWYPNMRLWRPEKRGDWSSVSTAMIAELQKDQIGGG